MSLSTKKSSASAMKPTPGATMAAKLRSRCNELTKEQRSAAYSRAVARIYGAKAQQASRA